MGTCTDTPARTARGENRRKRRRRTTRKARLKFSNKRPTGNRPAPKGKHVQPCHGPHPSPSPLPKGRGNQLPTLGESPWSATGQLPAAGSPSPFRKGRGSG